MTRYAFTADETHEEIIETEEEAGNHDSTASAIRTCIERSADLQHECDELEATVEELQQEITEMEQGQEARVTELQQEHERNVAQLEQDVERLQREKRMIIEQRDETEALQKYVEEEQSYRRASLSTRLRWWVFGMEDYSR